MIFNIPPIKKPEAFFSNVPMGQTRVQSSYADGASGGDAEAKLLIASMKDMSPAQQRRQLKALRKGHMVEIAKAEQGLRPLNDQLRNLGGMILCAEDLYKWAADFLVFEKPTGGAFHAFRKAVEARDISDLHDWDNRTTFEEYEEEIFQGASSFVIEHNWYGAINKAEDFSSGSFRLPFDICVFEFMVSRVRVLALAVNYPELNDGETTENEILMQIAIESITGKWALSNCIYRCKGDSWESIHDIKFTDNFARLTRLVGNQVRAACIALDAEVATTSVVRVPHVGRHKASAEQPWLSHHIISLAKKQRPDSLVASDGPRGVKRLHFRRGHWRHYTSSKSWVRWCLVGNPELGFIDKQYRL